MKYPELSMLIDGEWIPASERESLAVVNPSNGKWLGDLPISTDEDVARAADAAQRGFLRWRRTPPIERGRILKSISAAIRADQTALATVLTLEQGKTLAEAKAEIASTAETFEWMAEEGRRVYGRVVAARSAGAQQLVIPEPVGPVAAFSPWNYPAVLASRKIATALAAGCSVVIKPAEETPAIVVCIARIIQAAGVPNGVLNVLFGRPADVTRHLIGNPIVQRVSFTGSVAVGRLLSAQAGEAMKRITLELGGHSPCIVDQGVALDKVIDLAVAAKYRNAGQICHAPTRFFVHEQVFDRFVMEFARRANALKVGDGLDAGTQMGPLIHARRCQAMAEFVDDARRRGARLVAGGEAPSGVPVNGSFWAPTVLSSAPSDAVAMSSEVFGPIALVSPFENLDQVIQMANSTEYGLGAYAFTPSAETMHRLQQEIQAGFVSFNAFASPPAEMPFSGVKSSGLGVEMGIEGLAEHFHFKSVLMSGWNSHGNI